MFEIDGLTEFENELLNFIEVKFPEEIKKILIKMAYILEGKIKERTPVDTGRLRGSVTSLNPEKRVGPNPNPLGYEVGKIVVEGNKYYVEVFSNVEYAADVEYGHWTRNKSKFIKGEKMFKISVEELEKELPEHLKKWLENVIRELNL